jgi:hypothetical protein
MPAPRGGTTLWHFSFWSYLLVALEVSGWKEMLGSNELLMIGALMKPKIADIGFLAQHGFCA